MCLPLRTRVPGWPIAPGIGSVGSPTVTSGALTGPDRIHQFRYSKLAHRPGGSSSDPGAEATTAGGGVSFLAGASWAYNGARAASGAIRLKRYFDRMAGTSLYGHRSPGHLLRGIIGDPGKEAELHKSQITGT